VTFALYKENSKIAVFDYFRKCIYILVSAGKITQLTLKTRLAVNTLNKYTFNTPPKMLKCTENCNGNGTMPLSIKKLLHIPHNHVRACLSARCPQVTLQGLSSDGDCIATQVGGQVQMNSSTPETKIKRWLETGEGTFLKLSLPNF